MRAGSRKSTSSRAGRDKSGEPEARSKGERVTRSPLLRASGSQALRQFDRLLFGDLSQFVHGPLVELADALLGDAELLADLFERHVLVVVVHAGPHPDDVALARLQVLQ